MLNRPLSAPASDIGLLLARVILGIVMFAHGYQKMLINGIGRTTDGFENLSIPLAIVSASFVTLVEFAGGVLMILGALTTLVCVLMSIVMVGAAVFVHIPKGIFLATGGWELVGVITVGLLVLAAWGPGRYSIDRLIVDHRRRQNEKTLAFVRS